MVTASSSTIASPAPHQLREISSRPRWFLDDGSIISWSTWRVLNIPTPEPTGWFSRASTASDFPPRNLGLYELGVLQSSSLHGDVPAEKFPEILVGFLGSSSDLRQTILSLGTGESFASPVLRLEIMRFLTSGWSLVFRVLPSPASWSQTVLRSVEAKIFYTTTLGTPILRVICLALQRELCALP